MWEKTLTPEASSTTSLTTLLTITHLLFLVSGCYRNGDLLEEGRYYKPVIYAPVRAAVRERRSARLFIGRSAAPRRPAGLPVCCPSARILSLESSLCPVCARLLDGICVKD